MQKWLSTLTSLGLLTGLTFWLLESSNTPEEVGKNDYWGADIPDDLQEELFAVFENGQLTHDNLKIGVGNFDIETYINDTGETITGMRCGLWIYLRGDPEEYTIRVYPGQVVQGEGYNIRVHSMIRHENDRWSLQLGLKKIT